MKVAIISNAFFESTLPLVKNLSTKEVVRLYALFTKSYLNPPNFDISKVQSLNSNLLNFNDDLLEKSHYIHEYLKNNEIVKIAIARKNLFQNLKLTLQLFVSIRKFNPDIVHFIGHHYLFVILKILFFRKKIVHTFHEISTNRLNSSFKVNLRNLIDDYIINILIRLNISTNSGFIFHSYNVKNDFIKKNNYSNFKVIPFGSFEVYSYALESEINILPENYLLFFGWVKDYKGIDVLIEALSILKEQNQFCPNCVIAGKNADEYLKKCRNLENIMLIDKYLTDGDINKLIINSKVVVAPHKVISQSGIPNTAFALGRPVIASDLPGLTEYVHNKMNGMVFKTEDPRDLADVILNIYNNNSLYSELIENIKNKDNQFLQCWDIISKDTVSFYRNQ